MYERNPPGSALVFFSSSFHIAEDELNEMDDEPDPEKASTKRKAKDDLNIFSDSSSESEEEDKQLNQAGKELKAMLKVRFS